MESLKNLFKNAVDHTQEMDSADIQDNKVMGILAYCSWLVLVPIFAAKKSKFARFHANQGLVIAIVEAIISLVFGLLESRIPYVGWIFGIIKYAALAVCTLFSVLGIIYAATGKGKELPYVGKVKILK